ncbi:MAG: hypothetical protein WCE52_00790 [Candidatus Acidiferrum sp.]
MTQTHLRSASAALVALLTLPFNSCAIDSPLSDTAVRDAYFLGQRHDETLGRFFDKYNLSLPRPESGPYIQQVTLLTPYALMVRFSSTQLNYSAQQAQLDHKKMPEIVRVIIQIGLTDSYGPYLMRPTGSRSGSPVGIQLRADDFWKDFRVRLYNDDGFVIPVGASGQPTYSCDDQGGCILSGALVQFDYPAESFTGNTAKLQIDPPAGEEVLVDFDLGSIR